MKFRLLLHYFSFQMFEKILKNKFYLIFVSNAFILTFILSYFYKTLLIWKLTTYLYLWLFLFKTKHGKFMKIKVHLGNCFKVCLSILCYDYIFKWNVIYGFQSEWSLKNIESLAEELKLGSFRRDSCRAQHKNYQTEYVWWRTQRQWTTNGMSEK